MRAWRRLLATLDAVSVVVDRSTDVGTGDRHRAGLLHLVLIDFRVFRSTTLQPLDRGQPAE